MEEGERRILIFEDDYESMRDLEEHIEQELGWSVELSAAQSLLGRLAHEHFDLLIVDLMIHSTSFDAGGNEVQNVHFGGINWQRTGLEFLRRLRAGAYAGDAGEGTSPDVPVIVLSAVADSPLGEDPGRELPIAGYVEKPFRLDDMVARIRALLQE